jgi:Uma2 family endonuclease
MAFATGYSVPQSDPPRSPKETLPTMYDLPSEFPEEPGLPDVRASASRDELHDLQPQLLSRTLTLAHYSREDWFAASDLNVYYDVHHPLWHKRPDRFLAVGVPRLYGGRDLRRSYVTWQEGEPPAVVVEFLSPKTEQEDLGRFYREVDRVDAEQSGPDLAHAASAPGKLTVYERYLKVAHYMVYNRYTQHLRYFKLVGRCYEEQSVSDTEPAVWLSDLQIGLGIWEGEFAGIWGHWLRWCAADGTWLRTDTGQQQQRADRLAARLR